MHGSTHFGQGVDHSCDVAAMRWFAWRFPSVELTSFLACRDWPYAHVHHIVELEGDCKTLVRLGFVSPRMVPTGLRRSRHTHDVHVRCAGKDRLRLRMILWEDAPLAESHPLAALCPTRWPVVDAQLLARGNRSKAFLSVVPSTMLKEPANAD